MDDTRDAMPPQRRRALRSYPTGRCPECGAVIMLRADGRIATHRVWEVTLSRKRGWDRTAMCPGSKGPPVMGSARPARGDPDRHRPGEG